jgi:regulator of sirC expression with transglutaminase-like and TPR domain
VEPNPPSAGFCQLAERLRAGEAVGLADAALVLAAEFQPAFDPNVPLAALDRLGEDAARSVPGAGDAAARVAGLIAFLSGEAGFRGNQQQYDDPRNSFLDVVLERRTGIPITLAIVYNEVAARIGLELQGVSFPGHFLLRTPGEPPLVVDAFHGALLEMEDCEALLKRALGETARLTPEWLAPTGTRQVVVRMLGNLKHSHASRSEWVSALDCTERILRIEPDDVGELRDRGLLWEKLECFGPALADLERYLARVPHAPEAGALRARIEAVRSRTAAIH